MPTVTRAFVGGHSVFRSHYPDQPRGYGRNADDAWAAVVDEATAMVDARAVYAAAMPAARLSVSVSGPACAQGAGAAAKER